MTNAVTYAETELGIHQCFEDAKQAVLDSTHLGNLIVVEREKIRDLESQIAYREIEVADLEWTKHPDMAVTRMDKHVKGAQLKDDKLQGLHEQLRSAKNRVEEWELSRASYDAAVKVYTARMIELGGYLQYLAAAKTSQTVRATQEKQENPT